MIATLPARETRTTEDLVAPVAGEIRMMAAQAEASRRLPDELVACLKQAGLLSIYTSPDTMARPPGPSRWAWQTACSPRCFPEPLPLACWEMARF
jgi:hypothetical protein